MATPFVLDANIRIQQILGLDKVKQQLAGIQVGGIGGVRQLSTQIKGIGKPIANVSTQVAHASNAISNLGKKSQTTGRQIGGAAKSAQNFGDQIFLAGKRYAAFLSATVGAYKAFQLITTGTQSVIEFDQAMVSLSQILNTSVDQISNLSTKFLDLSVSTGTSAAEIGNVAKVLAQAGFRGEQLTEAVEQIAKVPLAPVFETTEQAVDGVIAALNQFGDEGLTVEQIFDKLTNVSLNYAASAADIIEGWKRGGAAFKAIGGTLDEFIAAFTTIRSVTREASSAVGTSLKTISSRLADPRIIKFLETKGIRLLEEGQFVGPLEALRRVGDAFDKIENVQERVNIATRLGGRRQISRFLAVAQNMDKANKVLETSQTSFKAFDRVAEQGLQAVGKQIDILVAQAKKLAIELGPDLFIPFIKGLTGAAEAAITVLDALKPILPLIGKIGAAVAGIALTRGIGGLIGPRIAQLAGPAAFAATAGGFRTKAAAGLVASPFAQAGLLIAASELAASFIKTSDGAETFASTLITQTALIATAIALFRKQTIAQFVAGGGLVPGVGKLGAIGGTLATIGAIALPLALIEGKKSAEELANKIVDSAIESVANIQIDPTEPQSVAAGINNLYRIIGLGVQELIESADWRRGKDPFKRIFQAAGRTFGNIIEGDFETLIRRGGLTTEDIGTYVQSVLDKIPQVTDNIIQGIANSLIATGADTAETQRPRYTERRRLIEMGTELGFSVEAAIQFADAIIKNVGGLEELNRRVQDNIKTIKIEQSKREELTRLTKIIIPPQLTGQLLQFSKAIDATTRQISTSAKLFESQITEITGGIQTPAFDFDFGTQQIRNLIRGGGLQDIFEFTPDIPRFIGGISEIEELLDQFIINISNLPTGANLMAEVDRFFDFQKNVPETVRNNFQKFFNIIAQDIQSASEGRFIDTEEIRDRFRKEFANLGLEASDAAVEAVGQFLENTFSQIQDELNRLATIRRFELEAPIRPETQEAFLRQQLRRVGITAPGEGVQRNILRGTLEELDLLRREREARTRISIPGLLPTPGIGFFQGRGQGLAAIAGDERIRQQVRDSFKEVIIESTQLKKRLAELQPGSEGFIEATQRAKELARQTIELQTTMEALDQATQQAYQEEKRTLELRQRLELEQTRARLAERVRVGAIQPIQAERVIFDLQKEQQEEQIALQDRFDAIIEKDNTLRVDLAREISENTKTQGEIIQDFDISVNVFANTIQEQAGIVELMKQHIASFGQAVINFSNLGATTAVSADTGVTTNITPTQIRSGGVNLKQAFDEYNRLINDSNINQKERDNQALEILKAIHERQDKTQSVKEDSSTLQRQKEQNDIANEKISQLTESLNALTVILNEPNELKLITDQTIDIDLSTLPSDISNEIRPVLEEAVMLAAKTVTRKALENLATKGDSELSIAANDVAQELV